MYIKQKQAIKGFSVTSEDYSGLKKDNLIKKAVILDIYKLNLHHVINLMFRVKNNKIPVAFENTFEIVQQKQFHWT